MELLGIIHPGLDALLDYLIKLHNGGAQIVGVGDLTRFTCHEVLFHLIFDFREVVFNRKELFKLMAFLDRWNQSQLLQVGLEEFSSILNECGARSGARGWAYRGSAFQCELLVEDYGA